jgi:hypothetical protein
MEPPEAYRPVENMRQSKHMPVVQSSLWAAICCASEVGMVPGRMSVPVAQYEQEITMQKYLIIAATILSLPSLPLADEANEDEWIDSFPIDDYTMVSEGRNRYWDLTPGRIACWKNRVRAAVSAELLPCSSAHVPT